MTFKERLLQKSNLWHVGAVAIFLLVSAIYFYPAFQGYSVEQSDVVNWVGASQEIADYREQGEEVGWTNSMFSGMPGTQISVIYEGRQIPDFLRKALSLWLPLPVSLLFIYFIGFYLLAFSLRIKPLIAIIGSLAFGLSSYFIIIIAVGHVTKAVAIGYAPMVIAGFIFAYRWKNWLLGVALSALFMTFELAANHLQITYYMAFVLVGLGVVELIRYAKMPKGLSAFVKITAGMLLAYGLAVMVNYGNIKGTQEYAKYTMRDGSVLTMNPDGSPKTGTNEGLERDYVTGWSYGKSETFTFLVPNFKGGVSQQMKDNPANDKHLKQADSMFRNDVKNSYQYWGDQPGTSGPVYIGAIVVLLALLSLYYSKEPFRWALLVVTVLTVMLSWGKNFMGLTDLFLDYLPGYDKFRAVTIILVVAELCIPVLGVLFLQRLFVAREEIAKNLKPFYIISGSLAFILLVMGLFPTAINSFLSQPEREMLESLDASQVGIYESFFDEVEKVRVSIFRADVWRSFLFVVLGAGAVLAFIRQLFSSTVLGVILGLLILTDLLLVDRRYLATEKNGKNFAQWVETYKQKYPYVAYDGEKQILALEIQENPGLAQKLDSALQVLQASDRYSDKDVSAAERQRLVDWVTFRTLNRFTHFRVFEEGNPFNSTHVSYFNKSIGGYHGAKLSRYQDLIEFHISRNNPAVLDMLNTKYYLRPIIDPNSGKLVNTALTRVNSTALGNAWLSENIRVVSDPDEEIRALNSGRSYKLMAFGNQGLLINGQPDSSGLVSETDMVQLLITTGIDSLRNPVRDTMDVQVPYGAATDETPIVFVALPDGSFNWTYAAAVSDSTIKPLLGVSAAGRTGWDPEKETIVSEEFASGLSQQSYSGEGKIELTSYHPELLTYSFSSPEKQLVVFSEIYYPLGWKAFVDGEEVPIHRVNYLLRAVEVPAGDHRVELSYELESYKVSGTIAWIGSILILLLLGTAIYWQSRLRDSPNSVETQQ